MDYKAKNNTLKGFGKDYSGKDLFSEQCDILMPCAAQKVLTTENAPNVKAKIILEGANGPTTPAADKILQSKGVLQVPDMFVNSGGVTVSYFEYLKNINHVSFGKLTMRRQHQLINEIFNSINEGLGGKGKVCFLKAA